MDSPAIPSSSLRHFDRQHNRILLYNNKNYTVRCASLSFQYFNINLIELNIFAGVVLIEVKLEVRVVYREGVGVVSANQRLRQDRAFVQLTKGIRVRSRSQSERPGLGRALIMQGKYNTFV